MKKFPHLIFDFDGVLAETNEIRISGFDALFRGEYPDVAVDALLQFSRANGGISRYVKIRYFFEQLLGREIDYKSVAELASEYSDIVKKQVISAPSVTGSTEFLNTWRGRSECAIISGSDELELNEVCVARGIDTFFSAIFGSPRNKVENFSRLFEQAGWFPEESLFIGDTGNDHGAALKSGVPFLARDSGVENWSSYNGVVLKDLTELEAYLNKYLKG